jgi:uncharacterized repeat protein (TIGR03803 family)
MMKSGMSLLCGAALLASGAHWPAQAQSPVFDTLYNFTATSGSDSNNLDGAYPESPLLLAGATLYGTAIYGGSAGNGTIFRIKTNGLDFTNLYNFPAGGTNNSGYYTNRDGANPFGGLILANNTLFGTTANGGSAGSGTVFRVNTDGSDFTNLHNFTATSGFPFYANVDGANPLAGLVLAGHTLYGTAQNGGDAGNGTVFRVNTDGSDFLLVHSFSLGSTNDALHTYTNSDGALPVAALILSGNTLFGTAEDGGNGGSGTVFSVNIDGSDFTNLYSFSANTYTPALGLYTNSDGAFPISGLMLSSNTLYGTAQDGGSAGTGTVFSLETNDLVFTLLHSFSEPITNATQADYTNTDGFFPVAPLILSGSTLYGTAEDGGSGDIGTVFRVNTDGSDFTNLYNFALGATNAAKAYTNSGGALPVAALTLSGNTLYGTAAVGGSQGDGTVFALVLTGAPSLAIVPSGKQVVISWPASAWTYVLQTTTNLASGSWGDITSGITTAGSNNVFTSTASGQAAYFRLQQQ